MPHTPTAKQVIVVDDDTNDFQEIAHALRETGAPFAVRRVEASDELDEELMRLAPDIVLCNHRGGKRDSLLILDRVRAFEPSMPLVVVSDGIDQAEESEFMSHGAD